VDQPETISKRSFGLLSWGICKPPTFVAIDLARYTIDLLGLGVEDSTFVGLVGA
jgi:hypothetical protein